MIFLPIIRRRLRISRTDLRVAAVGLKIIECSFSEEPHVLGELVSRFLAVGCRFEHDFRADEFSEQPRLGTDFWSEVGAFTNDFAIRVFLRSVWPWSSSDFVFLLNNGEAIIRC